MLEEIEAAAEWWASHLREPVKQDMGDVVGNAIMAIWEPLVERPTESQVREFKTNLKAILAELFRGDSWKPEQPEWGSSYRCIHSDYDAGPEVRAAAYMARIYETRTLFPIKSYMWVNPGKVTVRQGYHGEVQTIFERK